MAGDIYTKGFSNPETWTRLRMLINIFSPEEIMRSSFNPGLESYQEKDFEGVVIDEKHCNPHYTYIMSGEGSPFNDADFRKAVKKKKPKPKKKLWHVLKMDWLKKM